MVQLEKQGYIRGLAVTAHHIAVGVSSYRALSRSTGKVNNYADEGMPYRCCKVLVLNRETLHIQQEYDFSSTNQEVFDVRVVALGLGF